MSTIVNRLVIDFGIYFPTTLLGLKPIGTVSYIHLQLMIIELLDFESFSKWVDQILPPIDLLKVNVTSIHDLSDKMITAQNMFGVLMGSQLLSLSNGSSIVAV